MGRDLMISFLLRLLLIVSLLCIFGADTNCASPQLKKEVIEQQIENEEATAIAAEFIPAGPKRDKVIGALARSSDLLEKTDTAREKAEIKAQDLSEDAARWRLVKWLGIAAATLVAGFAVFRFGRSIPFIGKFLPGS